MYQKVLTNLNFVEREKKTEEFWRENHIFEKSIDSRKEGTVILYRETDVERLSGERKTAGGKQARNNP